MAYTELPSCLTIPTHHSTCLFVILSLAIIVPSFYALIFRFLFGLGALIGRGDGRWYQKPSKLLVKASDDQSVSA